MKKMIKLFYFTIYFFTISFCYGQLAQINSSTTAYFYDLSVIDNKIVIYGNYDYLVRSNDLGKTFFYLNRPSLTGYVTKLCRLDSCTIYLLSYNPSQTFLHKTSDCGQTWNQISTGPGSFNRDINFFDSNEGLMTNDDQLLRTNDAGATWINVSNTPFSIGKMVLKTFGDSTVCMGGVTVTGRGFAMSKDRGHTWPLGWGTFGHTIEFTDFAFLNKDTLAAVSTGGGFVSTTDGGLTWNDLSEPPITDVYGVQFKSGKECYIVGNNSSNSGVVLKTTDLGKTWLTFDTHIQTTLTNIALLTDSTAILTGNNGVILLWNYRTTIFTDISENFLSKEKIKVYPSPAKERIYVEQDAQALQTLNYSVADFLGQILYSNRTSKSTEEIDIHFLRPGIYFLTIQNINRTESRTVKFIKQE